jgi:hypothetical protein
MKTPIYSFGSPEPRTYYSFSGSDIKVYRVENSEYARHAARQATKLITNVDMLAYSFIAGTENRGSFVRHLYKGNQIPLTGEVYSLVFVANDEFGNQARMALLNIQEEKIIFDMSIDDAVMEDRVEFSFEEAVLWQAIVFVGAK